MINYLKLLLLLSIFIFNTGCVMKSTGSTEVGVRTIKWSLFNKSGVENKVYPPGSAYFFMPIINDWHTFDTKLQNIEMTLSEVQGDLPRRDDIRFKTIDGNDISLDLIISYRINPEKAPHILQYVSRNDLELRHRIVRTISRSIPRDIFGELQTESFYKAEKDPKNLKNLKKYLMKF